MRALNLSRTTADSRSIVCLLAAALFFDLFFDWRRASVETPALHVDAGSAAIAGWGALAAVVVVAVLGAALLGGRPLLVSALAVVAAAFVVVEFFTGAAQVDVAGAVSVDTSQRLWPAYVGLVLSGCLVAATTPRLLHPPRATAPLTGARPGIG
ncbi:MAG: hypothetical protein ACXWZY_03760 [Gaiellaceae bacterium]